jgi:hypothetical protein
VVLLPVPADGVARGEQRQEVRVQFLSRDCDQPARAGKAGLPFHVHLAVGSLVVLRGECRKEVVGNRLVPGFVFGEAADALRGGHVIAFHW